MVKSRSSCNKSKKQYFITLITIILGTSVLMTPFEFHTNMHFEEAGNNFRGTCPFCKKKDHFFFNKENQWDCKSCMLHGNLYIFLNHLFNDVCQDKLTTILAESRGIDHSLFVRNKIKHNPLNNTYIIPSFNSTGHINQLYKVYWSEDKWHIRNTPDIDATLVNWPENVHDTVMFTEGLWDKLAGEEMVGNRPITVCGFPGSTFKQTWCSIAAGKDVIICTDNDAAGIKMRENILNRFKQAPSRPKSIRTLRWPALTPQKFDVNDLLIKFTKDSYDKLMSYLVEEDLTSSTTGKIEVLPDTSCKTFINLTEACKEYYHYTKHMEMLTHFLITCVYALKFEGEQLWGRVIGPPGSSKTTIAKLVGSSAQTITRSTFTGLLSGWKDDDPNDASMIPLIAGKALIVKDADTILQLPNKDQIFSQLRDFYDKDISATYGNRLNYEYHNVRSAFLFLGTHALRGMDNTALGERFIDFEICVTLEDINAIIQKVLMRDEQVASSEPPENKLFAKSKNFIDNELWNLNEQAPLTKEHNLIIARYGFLVSYMRARVERTYTGDVKYNPFAEVPSRITGQFKKLLKCAPVVLGHHSVDDESIKLLDKVSRDIIDTKSLRYRIAYLLCKTPEQSLAQLTQFFDGDNPKLIERELDDMRRLDMLKIAFKAVGTSRGFHVASLNDTLQEHMREVAQYDSTNQLK